MTMNMTLEERINKLQQIIDDSQLIVVFSGAGVSTESGIPDFRSKDGLYNQHDVKFDKYKPEYLLSHSCLKQNPKVFFEFYRQKMNLDGIQPNITHNKLAELEQKGKQIYIVTQNIDGLHQKAGSQHVYEIHGTTSRNYCSHCKKEFPSNYIFESKDPIPYCDVCGKEKRGIIRPDVTLYEEALPKAYREASDIIKKADTMIVMGTSLAVYPAAYLVTDFCGENLIIINKEPTDKDGMADLIIHESLGNVFSKIK